MPEKTRLVHAFHAAADDRHLFIDDFIAVANRTMPDETRANGIVDVGQTRFHIHGTCRENNSARRDGFIADLCPEHAVRHTLKCIDVPGGQCGAITPSLLAKPQEELASADAVRKSRVVVRSWNERSAAGASIDHADAATKAPEINRACQAGRTSADDQAVEHASARLARTQASRP